MVTPINIVWFKRDLRLRDHAPLREALTMGEPYVLLYCFEPEMMAAPQHSPRHWRFVAESILDLQQRGWPVIVWWGGVVEALVAIRVRRPVQRLLSHQETGHELSFRRDQAVRQWCSDNGVNWTEYAQDPVIRGRKHRIGFAERVDAFLARPPVPSQSVTEQGPGAKVLTNAELALPVVVPLTEAGRGFTESKHSVATTPTTAGVYSLRVKSIPEVRQPGGETFAWRYLRSFLTERGSGYGRQIGNPSLSRRSCSRLSTYIAWGCISAREVYQWTQSPDIPRHLHKDLKMFRERLWWRAHYFQKLEAEYQLEHRPLNPGFTNLHRTRDRALLQTLEAGRTGVPMIDASVRCLQVTGWLNFRMRAMLATFMSFTLWLDFRTVAHFLSPLFLDYDPGIHYGQLQMQAGLTGYHPPRVYNPYVQGEEKDPEGRFVHEWVAELRSIPAPWCHYPHRLTRLERSLYNYDTGDYPAPIVDVAATNKANMERYWAVRKAPEVQAALPYIWARHCLPENIAAYEAEQG